jgi:hypothetical protein
MAPHRPNRIIRMSAIMTLQCAPSSSSAKGKDSVWQSVSTCGHHLSGLCGVPEMVLALYSTLASGALQNASLQIVMASPPGLCSHTHTYRPPFGQLTIPVHIVPVTADISSRAQLRNTLAASLVKITPHSFTHFTSQPLTTGMCPQGRQP